MIHSPLSGSVERNDQTFWSIVRILITTFFLIVVNILLRNVNAYIVLMIDLLLVAVFDFLDFRPMSLRYGTEWGNSRTYQVADKINDTVLLFIVLLLHIARVQKIGGFEILLFLLYLYRLIGVVLVIATKNTKYLILFPNFIMDNVILYLFLKYILQLPNNVVIPIVLLSIPLKVGVEVFLHGFWVQNK